MIYHRTVYSSGLSLAMDALYVAVRKSVKGNGNGLEPYGGRQEWRSEQHDFPLERRDRFEAISSGSPAQARVAEQHDDKPRRAARRQTPRSARELPFERFFHFFFST